jgi:hypothetical protein
MLEQNFDDIQSPLLGSVVQWSSQSKNSLGIVAWKIILILDVIDTNALAQYEMQNFHVIGQVAADCTV